MAGGLAGGIAIRRCSVGSVAADECLEVAFPGRYGLTVGTDSASDVVYLPSSQRFVLASAIASGSRLNISFGEVLAN